MHLIALHLGYTLMLAALAVRDILWLRSILVCAQVSLIFYSLSVGNTAVALWNAVFILINLVQVVLILRERRPILIPEDVRDLYQATFSAMSTREFLYFWEMGTKKRRDDFLIQEGSRQDHLLFLLDGTVEILKNGKVIASLGRGKFVSEMSFLTGEPASATVRGKGTVSFIAWSAEKIRSLESLNPSLYTKVQGILSRDLIDKIRSTSREHATRVVEPRARQRADQGAEAAGAGSGLRVPASGG